MKWFMYKLSFPVVSDQVLIYWAISSEVHKLVSIHTMPKAYRECSFCSNNSVKSPQTVFFSVTNHIRSHLDFNQPGACYICKDHFTDEDFKVHGSSKRLKTFAIPHYFPRQTAVTEHSYHRTTTKCLVGIIFWTL